MDLRSTLSEQVGDLVDWLLQESELDSPSALTHQEHCLGLKERAWFLREIVLPKIPTQKIAMATIEGTLPDRPDSLARTNGFLRGKGPNTEALMGVSLVQEEAASEGS